MGTPRKVPSIDASLLTVALREDEEALADFKRRLEAAKDPEAKRMYENIISYLTKRITRTRRKLAA